MLLWPDQDSLKELPDRLSGRRGRLLVGGMGICYRGGNFHAISVRGDRCLETNVIRLRRGMVGAHFVNRLIGSVHDVPDGAFGGVLGSGGKVGGSRFYAGLS